MTRLPAHTATSRAEDAATLLADLNDALLDVQHRYAGQRIEAIDIALAWPADSGEIRALAHGLIQLGIPHRLLRAPVTQSHRIHFRLERGTFRSNAMQARTLKQYLHDLINGAPDTDPVRRDLGRLLEEPRLEPESTHPTLPLIDAFREALTTATTRFIADVVAPVHADALLGYRIQALRIVIPSYGESLHNALVKLPAEGLNRLARARIEKARGAHLLDCTEFYGVTLEAPETLLDGQPVEVLASWGGTSLKLRFVFQGGYISLPARPEAVPVEEPKPVEPAPEPAPPSLVSKVPLGATPLRTTLAKPAVQMGETPLNTTIRPARQPIARLVARAHDKNGPGPEQSFDVYEDQLPFAIGCAPLDSGEYRQGLAITFAGYNTGEHPWVSDRHLVLQGFDRTQGELQLINRGRNGAWLAGQPLGERLLYRPNAQKRFNLGGPEGVGTAELRIEPVA
ncbi:MAG: hypothetical protein Q8Q28_01220 [Pseudomonadota bacterium]|nr:hypothetical protein [Pseudomonadota bacterium]